MEHPLLTPARCQEIIADALPDWGDEAVPLELAAGRILSQQVLADRDSPPFDRVCMDGIAVPALPDPGATWESLGVQAAGSSPLTLARPQDCCEVMTGSVLPHGAACVVPYEDLSSQGGTFTFRPRKPGPLKPRANVAPRGEDYRQGDLLLASGTAIGACEVGILASVGVVNPQVRKRPRIAVVSTGSELVDPANVPGPNALRRSNDLAVTALLSQWGLAVSTRHHLPDDEEATRALLAQVLEEHDVVITSGGVSRGRFDLVHRILPELGVAPLFHGVAQKPGKPLWCGATATKIVFGLPGNPVSALTSLRRFVVPALCPGAGAVPARLEPSLAPRTAFAEYRPCRRESGRLVLSSGRGSGDFFALAGTTGFVEVLTESGVHPFWGWAPGDAP